MSSPSVPFSRRRVPVTTAHDVLVLGRRFTAPEAKEAGVVHATCAQDRLIQEAVAAAHRFKGIPRQDLSATKEAMYADYIKIVSANRAAASKL